MKDKIFDFTLRDYFKKWTIFDCSIIQSINKNAMKDKDKINECSIFWITEISCSEKDIGKPNHKSK